MDSRQPRSLARMAKKIWSYKDKRGDMNTSNRFASPDDEESLYPTRAVGYSDVDNRLNDRTIPHISLTRSPTFTLSSEEADCDVTDLFKGQSADSIRRHEYKDNVTDIFLFRGGSEDSTGSDEEEEEDEDFVTDRLIFQGQREVSIDSKRKLRIEMELHKLKEENLRSSVPYLGPLSNGSEKQKMPGDIIIDVYKSTTTPLHLATQVLAALAVSLGSMVVGFSSGYTSPALVTMTGGNDTFTVTHQQASWIGGIMPLAALVGGILGGPLIEKFGRRMTILATAPPFALAWLLIACAPDVWTVLSGRALSGLCVGIASLSLPVYLGETLQPEVRGTLGLLPTALGNIGILLVFSAGMYLDWRALAYLGAALPLPFFLLTMLIPETPHWHVTHGNEQAARESLQWLRGGASADVTTELKSIVNSQIEAERTSKESTLKDLLAPNNLKPLMISLGLMFFQQFSGINAVIFYTVMIFKDAGSTIDGNICTIIVGLVNFGATFLATVLIDRLGRKVLLYISGLAMVITLMTLGGFFYVKHIGMDVSTIGWLPLASFVVFVIGFSLGFGPVPWLMMGEILPSKVRGSAASVATAFNWMCTFLVTKSFTDIINAIGSYGAFWIFGSVCVISLFFVFFFVPETRGRSLEDIELSMRGRTRRMSSLANMKPMPTAC